MGLTEEELRDRIASGRLVERPEHATRRYLDALAHALLVWGDTELISAPAYMRTAAHAPRINSRISLCGIVQDELGHAQLAFRLLRDLGLDVDALVYEREPRRFLHPYALDVPLESWAELVVANAFYDRAGFFILDDVHRAASYGPLKRALAKVEREETFHLRHGERWLAMLSRDPDGRRQLQAAVDWMFGMTLEWFGLPDGMKRHDEAIAYGLRGATGDELRQAWLGSAVPVLERYGLRVPAHREGDRWALDCPFPCEFDPEAKRWLEEEGEISWHRVLRRWARRGPAAEALVEQVQRGRRELARLTEAA